MKDVYGWAGRTALAPRDARARLEAAAPGFTWAVRESDAEGDYVNGVAADGARVRLLGDPVDSVELWLPGPARGGPLPDARVAALRAQVPALLTALGAAAVVEE